MEKPAALQDIEDYCLALLWLMGRLERAEVADTCSAFKEQFAQLMTREQHELKLRSSLHAARQKLVSVDLIGSGGRGIWIITPIGEQWLRDQTDPLLAKAPLHSLFNTTRQKRLHQEEQLAGEDAAAPLRRKGDSTLIIASDAKQSAAGRSTTRRGRKSRAEAASLRRARTNLERIVNDIHRLLQGTLPVRPSDKELCDWVQFCAMLELYSEACHLFPYISPVAVDAALYQCTRERATQCCHHVVGRNADLQLVEVKSEAAESNGVVVFDNDDEGYLAWLDAHPEGFVLNTRRSKAPDSLVLHRAGCSTLKNRAKSGKAGGLTERNIKVCAMDVDCLKRWAKQQGRDSGALSQGCSLCKPFVER